MREWLKEIAPSSSAEDIEERIATYVKETARRKLALFLFKLNILKKGKNYAI